MNSCENKLLPKGALRQYRAIHILQIGLETMAEKNTLAYPIKKHALFFMFHTSLTPKVNSVSQQVLESNRIHLWFM